MQSATQQDQTGEPPGAREAILRLADVQRTFVMGEVRVTALRDVTLEIYAGEFLVVVGPSGSGKSTLLNLVGGLDAPSRGRIWYRNREITEFSPRELTWYRRERVGFVFQFYNLVANLTARENVLVATELSAEPLDPVEALRLVDLEDRQDHFPAQLSGGEQQRVAIARALAKNPELILCDEPTGALDFATGKKVLGLLSRLQRELGKTVVIITHNTAIAQMADRIARLRSGQVIEMHTNREPLPPEAIQW